VRLTLAEKHLRVAGAGSTKTTTTQSGDSGGGGSFGGGAGAGNGGGNGIWRLRVNEDDDGALPFVLKLDDEAAAASAFNGAASAPKVDATTATSAATTVTTATTATAATTATTAVAVAGSTADAPASTSEFWCGEFDYPSFATKAPLNISISGGGADINTVWGRKAHGEPLATLQIMLLMLRR